MATVGTLVPFWEPFAVPVRAALAALPAWRGALAVVLSAATIVVLTLFGARIHRGGSLHLDARMGWVQSLRRANA